MNKSLKWACTALVLFVGVPIIDVVLVAMLHVNPFGHVRASVDGALAIAALVWIWTRGEPNAGRAQPGAPVHPDRFQPIDGAWLVSNSSALHHWVEPQDARLKAEGGHPEHQIYLAQTLPVKSEREALHFKLIGSTGTGKSTSMRHKLNALRKRGGDRVVIADPDGGYAAKFFRPDLGDIIVNPFDDRGLTWDLLADIRGPADPKGIAASLVPSTTGSQAEWQLYAQQFVASCMESLHRDFEREPGSKPTVTDLFGMVSQLPVRESKAAKEKAAQEGREPNDLETRLRGTVAAQFMAGGNEKMFGSIRAIAVSALEGLSYANPDAQTFSVVDYIHSDARGWVFITYRAGQIAALKGIIAAMMRTAIFSTMDRPFGDSRTWFVIDELDALGKIEGLRDGAQRLRKFGGRLLLAFQSIGALTAIYGKEETEGLLGNLKNVEIFNCGGGSADSSTAKWASDQVGSRRVWRKSDSTTNTSSSSSGINGNSTSGTSSTSNSLQADEPAISATEIEKLDKLIGVCHVAETAFWSYFNLPIIDLPDIAAPFVPLGQQARSEASVADALLSQPVPASVQPIAAAKAPAARRSVSGL